MPFVITYVVPVLIGIVLAFLLNINSQAPIHALIGMAGPAIGGIAYMQYALHFTDQPHLILGAVLGLIGWVILYVLYRNGLVRLEYYD